MDKYLIVTDSTSAMDKELSKKYNIELISLSVIIDNKEYKDQIDMSTEELYGQLKEDKIPSTSQPNTGYLVETMEQWKKENYEAIIVVTCSSDLSGTYNGFHLAAQTVGLDNIHIYDSRQVGAPIMDMAIMAKQLANNGASVEEIMNALKIKTANSFSFLYPDNFTQLSRSGRLSPMAARCAKLLKIKALLYLDKEGKTVDKYTMVRTETKILKEVVKKFEDDGVNGKDYTIYISHADNDKEVTKISLLLKTVFRGIEIVVTKLPAVLTCHGGLGCVAIHYTYNIEVQ